MAQSANPTEARIVAVRIVERLRAAGHIALFAGGCVRDELLGLHPTDFDVATDATPDRIRELFPRSTAVGEAFGVILVHDRANGDGDRVNVEVATFRSDGPYSDARRPDRVHFSDPKSDAERRDFTINALFLDPLEDSSRTRLRVIDYVGGQSDLAARVIRAVGEPERRLAEDHLRALRAVRFAARLGFKIDGATADAIRRTARDLRGVSRERVGDELRRMMSHDSRGAAINLLTGLGLDAPILNEEPLGGTTEQPGLLAHVGKARGADGGMVEAPRFATCLGAWAIDRATARASPEASSRFVPLGKGEISEVVPRWRDSLCLSNGETEEFSDVLEVYAFAGSAWGTSGVATRKRVVARRGFGQAMLLAEAGLPEEYERIFSDVKALESDGIGIAPQPLITGDTLVAAGMKPGPSFRGILDTLYDRQLEGSIRTSAEAMELAKRLYV